MKMKTIGFGVLFSFAALSLMGAEVTMDIDDDATALVVNVPAGLLTGSKLELAYDNSVGGDSKFVPLDRSPSRAAWSNVCTVSEALPAEGGTFTIALEDLGVAADACFRLFTTGAYQLLDYAWSNASDSWVDTGIKDTDVYGLELGLCPTDTVTTYPFMFGSKTGNGAGVSIQHGNSSPGVYNGAYFSRWTDGKYTYCSEMGFRTSQMNTIDFRNNSLKFNGANLGAVTGAKKWVTSPVGPSGHTLSLNRIADEQVANARTKWYYVKFYDKYGVLSLDYLPIKINNVVGFYDRVAGGFVTPTIGGKLTAGTATNEAERVTLPVGRLRSFSRLARRPAVATIDTTVGATLTVKVNPGYGVGTKLYLAHGTVNGRDDDIAAWSDLLVVAESIPASGGTYTVDLVAAGLNTGCVFRVFAGDRFTTLARVQQDSEDDVINSGIRDQLVFGCAWGYCCTGYKDNAYAAFLATGAGDNAANAGFRCCLNGGTTILIVTQWCNNKYTYRDAISMPANTCNAFAIVNDSATYNGGALTPKNGNNIWTSTPIGSSCKEFTLGMLPGADKPRCYGWWYYLTMTGEDGKLLLDYVPVKNGSETVGFFDRVSASFITPTNGGALVAGEEKTAAKLMAMPLSEMMSADPQLPITATWHGGADGDLNAAANWACTNAFGAELANTLPRAGVTTATFVGPVGFSAATAETVIWGRSIFVDGSLAADCDWSGLRGDMIEGPIDLAGHSLALTSLPPVGEFTSSTEGDVGELHVTVAEGKTLNNTGVALSGNLRFVKEGPGLFIATKSPQTYTGGNDVLAGTLKCGISGTIAANGHNSCFGLDPVVDVRTGATLDYAGTFYWGYHTINLHGGTLMNTVRPKEYHFNPNLNLYADSFYDAAATGDFQTNSDNLNGHTLNFNIRDLNWVIINSKFKNGTVVVTGTGCFNFESGEVMDCSTASFDISSQLNMNGVKGVTVSNFVVRCAEGKVTGHSLAQPFRVKGRFTPVSQTFPKIELQNGATLDLSGKNDAWSVASTVANCSLTFAANATVTVDTGARVLTEPRLVAWDEGNPPANVGTLTAVSNRPRVKLVVRDNGIYALGGIVIICR